MEPDFTPAEKAALAAFRLSGFDILIIETTVSEREDMALSSPRQGEILKPSDVVGHLLIVRPTEFLPEVPTSFGKSDAVRVDVCDLNANADNGEWGVVYRDVLWFNKFLLGLKKQIGESVCGWMAQGVGKPGQDPPFQLADAMGNPDAVRVAQSWLDAHPEFEAASNVNTPNGSAPQSAPPAQQPQLPLPGQVPSAQVPLGTGGTLGNTAHPVPAAPAMAPPAPTAPMPVPGSAQAPGQSLSVANLGEEQKQALRALGYQIP